jgi:tetratricopeptide (TPR) repeat protein
MITHDAHLCNEVGMIYRGITLKPSTYSIRIPRFLFQVCNHFANIRRFYHPLPQSSSEMDSAVHRRWLHIRMLACVWLLLIVPLGGCSRLRQFVRNDWGRADPSADSQMRMTGDSTAMMQSPAIGAIQNDDPDKSVHFAKKALEQRDHQTAAKHVATALELDPEHAGAWLIRGKLAEATQNQDRALEAYLRSASCSESDPEASLCVARLQLAEGQAAQTSPLLRAVIDSPQATAQQRSEATWLLGMTYVRTDRWDHAATALAKAASQRKMSADDWYWLALSRYQAGDSTGARNNIARVREMQPQHRGASMLLVELNRVVQPDNQILPARGTATP